MNNPPRFFGNARASRLFLASVFAVLLFPMRLHAAPFFYLDIQEIYTTADGSVQFIELFSPFANAGLLAGQTMTVSNGTTSHQYTFPTNISGNTANHTILIGTRNLPLFGGPAVDFVLGANFLFPNTTSIALDGFAQGTVTIPFLPTDGTQSLAITTTPPGGSGGVTSIQAVNSPQNLAGATGPLRLSASISTVVRDGTGFVITGKFYPGGMVYIQAASDLVSAFSTIGTVNADGSGTFSYTDASATSRQTQFYHAAYFEP